MKIQLFLLFAINLVSLAVPAADHSHHAGHHHNHADDSPIGVMGGHTHSKGTWMFSYRYMRMQMDGMRDGTDDLTDAEVLRDFRVTPVRMTMQMHMFGAMVAPSDDLTLMLMLPWVKKDMDHMTRMGTRFTTRSEGPGDIRLSSLYVLKRWHQQQVHLNVGISLPTGDIDEKDDTPAMANAPLPYPMQTGSGSWDLLPGLTWIGQSNGWSWGGQLMGTVRLNDNDNDYRLGNRLELSAWASRKVNDIIGASLRFRGLAWGDVDGADPKLKPNVVPTADPNLQGGQRLDILAGLNVYTGSGAFRGHRLALEFGAPVYENLDGPQMSTRWMLTAGWQYVR